jgi:hypothetical protein
MQIFDPVNLFIFMPAFVFYGEIRLPFGVLLQDSTVP